MPRGVTIYNCENDEIEASVGPAVVGKIDRVTAASDSHHQSSLKKVTASMTANEKAEENRLAMAVEFDHMYLGCSETKASIGKDIEVQHLKDLLLLHLDLIQQQAEQLVAKDKLIKSLHDENENLRARLDRIDRRVSLSLNKKSSESSSLEIKPESESEDGLSESPLKRLGSPTSKAAEVQSTKNQSPSSKNALSSKALSPSNKPLSPSSKPGSPSSKPGSPPCKPRSPPCKPRSPPCMPRSPPCKPRSPPSKTGSPSSKPVSPVSKPGSPSSKPGSPLSKPGSPLSKSPASVSKPVSPTHKIDLPTSKSTSPANKLLSPNNKTGLPIRKSLSPQARVSSPPGKPLSPNSKTSPVVCKSPSLTSKAGGSPQPVKPSSPQPKTPQSHQDDSEVSVSKVSSPCSVESLSPSSRSGASSRNSRRPSPRWMSPKTLPRESRQRNVSQSQSSENDAEVEPLRDLPKGNSEKERPKLKRKSDSESDSTPLKRIRSDRDRTSSSVKDDGLTDHNLRSRDKSRDRSRSTSKQEDHPDSPGEVRSPTPTPRAAALEAKKLRQKLQLKEQTRQGHTYGHDRGKTPSGISVRAEGILNTSVSYFLPYGTYIHDPNPEEEECLQAQVEIPRWGTRILTSLYVMEGTENLEDEIFLKRHAKPEQDEKRRKRWDLQRMREQRHYERLRERYESRQSANEPASSSDGSLWPWPESAMYLHVEDTLPVCAFGQPLARIPPQEFAIPWLSGQSFEGVTTRRRKR